MSQWNKENQWEKDWWGTCQNTFWEEQKQQVYAEKMGLHAEMVAGKFPLYDLKNTSVLDIGGGPVSLLLKCETTGKKIVLDPCPFPRWVGSRYAECNIERLGNKGEDLLKYYPNLEVDEVWIYNVLQHTDRPQKIIQNAQKVAKLIRIFEWVDTGTSAGHPHNLTEIKLNKWLKGEGKVERLAERGCFGKAYYGIFPAKI